MLEGGKVHLSVINLICFGPSGVRAPAVSTQVATIGPSGVCALPLAAGTNEGGHYFRYFSTFLVGVTTVIQNHRRGCRIVSNFCMGP